MSSRRMADDMAGPSTEAELVPPAALVRAILAATTGDQVTLPRSVVAALLDAVPAGQGTALQPVDLTVPELAARFNRSPSTIRQWLERKDIPTAYRLQGREWRVPAAALATFRPGAREQVKPTKTGEPPDLSGWRKKAG